MSKAANALKSNKVTNLWKSIKKFCSRNLSPYECVDGIKGGKNIAQLFKSKYENLFSSVPSCQTDLANIAVDIENRVKTQCSRSCCYSQHSIGVYDIKHAIKQLKHGKHDGHNAVYSDHFIHGTTCTDGPTVNQNDHA